MAAFEDTYVTGSDTDLASHTPTVSGTGYTQIAGSVNNMIARAGSSTLKVNAASAYQIDDLGSADQYMECQLAGAGFPSSDNYFCCRMVDEDNFIGVKVSSASSSELFKRKTSEADSPLVSFNTGGSTPLIRIECVGSTIEVFLGGVSQGSVTETDFQTETRQGLVADGAGANTWVDTLEADVIGGGGAISVTGATANYNYTGIVGDIELTGEIIVTGGTANYDYNGITGTIDLTGEVIVTGQTANYNYTAITGTIELGAEIIVTGATANYDYSAIDGTVELTGLITVIGQTANYNYDGVAADIILQGSIIVTGSTANYDYNALNGTIILQGPLVLNPRNIIRVKRKSNTIRIKRKTNIVRVR